MNKKLVDFNFQGERLSFKTSLKLFSHNKIDEGSKELLNSLRKNKDINYEKILDLGCGYGVLGIFLKKKFPDSGVVCTDRDLLAVEFTNQNAELNSVKINAFPSLDFESINSKFNLIVCNFPAKLEKEGLEYFIKKSSEFLEENGTLAIVVVKELEKNLGIILEKNLDKINIRFQQIGKDYSVYHLSFKKKLDISNFSYINNSLNFKLGSKSFNIKTTGALREFDTLHFTTDLVLQLLNEKKETVTIINPNQGVIPIAVNYFCSPKIINLVSKDLLQLKVSSENLKYDNFKKINSDFYKGKSDLLIWSILDEEVSEICDKLSVYLKQNKKIIFAGRTNIIKRVLGKMKLKSKKDNKKGKYSVVEI